MQNIEIGKPSWPVLLDGALVGEIRMIKEHETRFQYFPIGQSTGGEIFSTFGDVVDSLRGD